MFRNHRIQQLEGNIHRHWKMTLSIDVNLRSRKFFFQSIYPSMIEILSSSAFQLTSYFRCFKRLLKRFSPVDNDHQTSSDIELSMS